MAVEIGRSRLLLKGEGVLFLRRRLRGMKDIFLLLNQGLKGGGYDPPFLLLSVEMLPLSGFTGRGKVLLPISGDC